MCGLWGAQDHWSDPARLPSRARQPESSLRNRMAQAATISQFTRMVGVSVRDWCQSSWVVENTAGVTEIVSTLPDVWLAAERLGGRRVDPLALPFIQAFEARQRR